jgi:hypothetical protein
MGRPFVGIARPKGYRQMTRRACFFNAGRLVSAERGQYCEGFVTTPSGWRWIHHAWVTLDGKHAIDTTLPYGPESDYFGIVFPIEVFASAWIDEDHCAQPLLRSGDWTVTHGPILPPVMEYLVQQGWNDAIVCQPRPPRDEAQQKKLLAKYRRQMKRKRLDLIG